MNARESLVHAVYPEAEGPGTNELIDAYRAEVLAEAADELDRIAEHYGPSAQVLRDAAGNVRYMARKDTREGESTEVAPSFFRPGRTYVDGDGFRAPETLTLFRVETVARHPSRGILRAIGWAKIGAAPGGTWHGYFQDEGESTGWTEYAEGEASRD